MSNLSKQLVLVKEDYLFLKNHINSISLNDSIQARNASKLAEELSNEPMVLESSDIPKDVVRINSDVTIQDKKTKKVIQFTLVLPGEANIQLKKVSIYTPMGTAVIGYKEGDDIIWEMPAGSKEFTILRVVNK